jgi:long-chain acyl-CoA synthetase
MVTHINGSKGDCTARARISDVIKPWCDEKPEQPALVEGGSTWNYKQLATILTEAKNWLLDYGIRPGDRVILAADNSRAFVPLLLALAQLDAWPVPVGATASAHELNTIYRHCRPRCVLTIIRSTKRKTWAELSGTTTEKILGLGSLAVSPLNEQCQPETVEPDPSDRVGALLYTSGTTGLPKGVMLSHRALLFVAAASAKIRSLGPSDRLFGALPMFHAVGLSVVLLGGLMSGSSIHLVTQFNPIATLRTLEEDGITVVLGAPAMFSLLVEHAKLRGIKSLRLPLLRIIASCSAPLDPLLKSQVESLFGLVLHNGYGLTECSPTIAQTRIESPRRDTSVGPILPGMEFKLVMDDGSIAPEGTIGELLVRGPNLMRGYYRATKETEAVIDREGWFNTRDLARVDGENLLLIGRTRDLIIHFGHNVYPLEVESVLNSHPAVKKSAVMGRPCAEAQGGEEIIAAVELYAGSSVSVGELAEYASQRLSTYKRPSCILLVDKMPETSTGKVIKAELRKMAESVPAYNIDCVPASVVL